MRKILFVLLLSLIGISTQAQDKKSKNAKHTIAVQGNCEMCKKRIEKAAFSVPGVKSAVWNPEDKNLQLIVNEEKATDIEIQKAIAKVGHDTEKVKATDDDYAKLHTCCAYDRN